MGDAGRRPPTGAICAAEVGPANAADNGEAFFCLSSSLLFPRFLKKSLLRDFVVSLVSTESSDPLLNRGALDSLDSALASPSSCRVVEEGFDMSLLRGRWGRCDAADGVEMVRWSVRRRQDLTDGIVVHFESIGAGADSHVEGECIAAGDKALEDQRRGFVKFKVVVQVTATTKFRR
jgi:hypothetical protein